MGFTVRKSTNAEPEMRSGASSSREELAKGGEPSFEQSTSVSQPVSGPKRFFSTLVRRIPTWLWIVLGVIALLLALLLSPFIAIVALIVTITGIVALVRDTPTWLRFASRKRAMIWTAASALVFIGAGSVVTVAASSTRSTENNAPVAVATASATHTPTPSTVTASASSTAPKATPSATPFPDDAATLVAFTGQAGTAKDASATTAQSATAVLATLEVKGRAPKTGYERAQFGQRWLDVDRNGCDTRNDVLARDLSDVARSGPCTVTSGTLLDPFTGTTIAFVRGQGTSELVQIDHVVSLSDAWQKGAQKLTADQRATFANDPLNLLAVSGAANKQKGDGDAATWLPSNQKFRCAYVSRQVAVKATYGLWVTQAEHDAIARVLADCPDESVSTSSFAAPAPLAAPVPAQPEPAPAPAPAAPVRPEPAQPAPAQPAPVAPAPAPVPAAPQPPENVYYKNCDAVRAAGAAPLYAGSPGYSRKLDRDGDGIACE